jgi:hypothetical protein
MTKPYTLKFVMCYGWKKGQMLWNLQYWHVPLNQQYWEEKPSVYKNTNLCDSTFGSIQQMMVFFAPHYVCI